MIYPCIIYGISYGTEHSVQITSDTLSNHILTSADSVSVVILHLFKEFAAKATKNLTVKEHYDIALSFLKQCGEAGLFYE